MAVSSIVETSTLEGARFASLEDLFATDPARALRPGALAGATSEAGVAWATTEELCRGWLRADTPFSQLHGHCCAYDFDRSEWRAQLPASLRSAAITATSAADHTARHLRVPIGGHEVVGIDPGYGASRPRWPLVPVVFHEATLLFADAFDPASPALTAKGPGRGGWRRTLLHR